MNHSTILVIDDDDDFRHGLVVRLEAHSYAAEACADATSAMSVALRCKPDLIVLDVALPGGNGFQVLRRIRNDPILNGTPVIILTALGRDFKGEALRLGANAFFVKPAVNDDFLDTVATLLGVTGSTRGT